MRVYLDGVKVAETQGRPPQRPSKSPDQPMDPWKLLAFHRALVKNGLQDTYEAAEARTALELLAALQTRRNSTPPSPGLGAIPPCNQQAVDSLYFNTAQGIGGGLLDRLTGRSIWPDRVGSEIVRLAKVAGLIP